jgi:hypothetical protein
MAMTVAPNFCPAAKLNYPAFVEIMAHCLATACQNPLSEKKFMSICRMIGVSLFALFSAVTFADQHGANPDKPSLHTSTTMAVSMQVKSVNRKTREVVLVDPQGELITFTAGDEMRNLAQLKPGDIVATEHTQKQSLEVYDKGSFVPETGDFSAMGSAEKGEKPGMTAFETTVVTATVEDINLEDNTFKLRWFDDSVEQFTAMNPENLKKADVGDHVVITDTVTVNVSITDPDAE